MTQLKDVIHFYLWQDLRIYDKATEKWSGWKKLTPKVLDYVLQSEISGYLVNFEMQLSLFRLEDMTKEQWEEFNRFSEYDFNEMTVIKSLSNDGGHTRLCHSFTAVAHLASKGFDLFSLIDSNQAIDKNKITTP